MDIQTSPPDTETNATDELTAPMVPSAAEPADIAAFWTCAADLDEITIRIIPPAAPLAILERLGPSPFPRGGFPLIGFLATTYEKVSRYALDGM